MSLHVDAGTPLPDPPPGAVVEFDRLRRKLGFLSDPAPAIAGRYEVERTLGRGAMGEVHLVLDTRLSRRVALKLVKPSANLDPAMLQARLEREALALARVDHPHVVALYDVGQHEGQTYLTMQYVPGVPLRDWQAERTSAELIDAYLQAARGLAAAHAAGVVHRDFKPDNVIVGDDGVVRVLDFGIAAALQGEGELETSRIAADDALGTNPAGAGSVLADRDDDAETTPSLAPELSTDARARPAALTRPNTLLGTLPYMAAEQLQGRRADARSDQFGFCVAMWEALSGARPFQGPSPYALLSAIEAGPRGGERLPAWLRPILRRGLALAPSRRWPDMVALIAAIERVQKRRRHLALGMGVGAALLSASVVGWALAPGPVAPLEACDAWLDDIDATWGPAQREQLRGSVEGDYVIAQLDDLAADWRRSAAARCVEDAAPRPDDPARGCLDVWREDLDQTLGLLLERGDRETLARAPDLLARLQPPGGDHCALQLGQAVDPEVERLSDSARALIVLGDVEAADRASEQALARAEQLDAGGFGVELAVAHFARAEVAAFAGEVEPAMQHLAASEQHALASTLPEVLLPTWTLWAKLLALSGVPEQAEPAVGFAARAEALGVSLEIVEPDTRAAELLEARGLCERARARHEAAIALHRRARDQFVAAGQPTLAAKSLVNVGANFQLLGDAESARGSYAEAIALLIAAGLPPSYRSRIQLERNLGLLAYEETEPAELTKGIAHFEFVRAHGTVQEAREALELLIGIAIELEDPTLLAIETDHALRELEGELEGEARVHLQRAAGFGLLHLGEEARGEALLEEAARAAESLSPELQFNLHDNWISWLESNGRCDAAASRRTAITDRMQALPTDQRPSDFDSWLAAGPQHDCAPPRQP